MLSRSKRRSKSSNFTAMPKLIAHYDYVRSKMTLALDSGGGLVSQWNDISPTGNHLTQSGTNRPTFDKDGVLFTAASSTWMFSTAITWSDDFSIICVVKPRTTPATNHGYVTWRETTSTDSANMRYDTASSRSVGAVQINSGTSPQVALLTAAQYKVNQTYIMGIGFSGSANQNLYRAYSWGYQSGSNAPGTGSFSNTNKINVGRLFSTSTALLDGWIMKVMIFHQYLGPTRMAIIGNKLRKRFRSMRTS